MLRLVTHKEYCRSNGPGIDESYHNYKLKEIEIHIRTMFRYRLREPFFKLDAIRHYQCSNGLCGGDLRRPSRVAFGQLKPPPVVPEIPRTDKIEGCGWGEHDYKLSGFHLHLRIRLPYRFQKLGFNADVSTHYRCSECYSDMWKQHPLK